MTFAERQRLLRLLLRLAGCVTILAFSAMLLPADRMAATHEWLGLGDFPRAPVAVYLARSIAALYGFQGVMLLIVSRDVQHYRGFIRYLGVMNVVLGVILLAIDLHSGMPAWWTFGEGPPVTVFGLVILLLNRSPADA